MLDNATIQQEILNHKVKEGHLEKQSRFLKQWRQRWVVLTTHYLFTFKSKEYTDPTDILELQQLRSIKSYLYKFEDSTGFKLAAQELSIYFKCRSNIEKWSWIVAIERTMDYSIHGASNYNNIDYLRKKGFDAVDGPIISPGLIKKSSTDYNTSGRSRFYGTQVATQNGAEQTKQQPKNILSLKQIEKSTEVTKETVEVLSLKVSKQEIPISQPKKEVQPPAKVIQLESTKIQTTERKVSELRGVFQKRISENSKQIPLTKISSMGLNSDIKPQRPPSTKRSQIVQGIFDEFESEKNRDGFRYYLEFLVHVAAEPNLGFTNYVVAETKTHTQRKTFVDGLIEFCGQIGSKQIRQATINAILSYLYTLYYEAPDVLHKSHINKIKKCLIKCLCVCELQRTIESALRCILIINKSDKFNAIELLDGIVSIEKKTKNQQVRGLIRKCKDIIS